MLRTWKGMRRLQERNWFGRLSIRHKLMAAAIACILIPAALTQLIYNSLTQEAVQRQAISNAQDSLLLVDGSVSNLFQGMLNVTNYIQMNSDMNSYFKVLASGQANEEDEYRSFTNKNRIIQQLDSLTVSERSYVSVLLTDGTAFTNYSMSDYNPASLRKESWFGELNNLKGLGSYWVGTSPTVFEYLTSDSPYQISLARTLRRDDSRIYGYVVVTVLEKRVNQLFKRLPSNQEVMLLDENNRILSSGDPEKIGQTFEDAGASTGGLHSSVQTVDGTKYLITEKPLSFNDWRLVSKQRYEEAIVNISSIFNRVFLVQFTSLVIFLLLLLALLRAFTKPFVQLGKTVSAVQRGNLGARSGIRGRDEIGRLGFLLDQMLGRVQEMITEVSETQARKRKAELKMLQAQIHPHFLFNVLNSIRMKVMRRGDSESAKMIGSLSTLLRMTIKNEEDEIYLHEELELLSHYVELMNLRQKEEVRLTLDIVSEAMLVRVPRLFLQPLVENALIHGFNQKSGHVRVGAEMQGGTLVLAVEDNGIGMDEQAVDALNKKLLAAGASVRPEAEPSGGMGTVGSFSGLGLANVAERMKLLRGERFSMTVESIPDQGTTIRLMIADERADEDV